VLSAVTTGGIIAILLGDTQIAAIISAVSSTTLLATNAYTKELDLGELSQKHKSTALDLWGLREAHVSLLTDLKDRSVTPEQAVTRRDELQSRLEKIYDAAPRTLSKAYTAAQKALQINEELTFSDAEINALLPPGLREAQS